MKPHSPTLVRHNGGRDTELDAEQVLAALMELKKGQFGVRLPVAWTGINGKVADAFNEVTEMMSRSTVELSRISRVVGKEGKIQERLTMGSATGRNVHQRPLKEAVAMCNAISALTMDDASLAKSMEIYRKGL